MCSVYGERTVPGPTKLSDQLTRMPMVKCMDFSLKSYYVVFAFGSVWVLHILWCIYGNHVQETARGPGPARDPPNRLKTKSNNVNLFYCFDNALLHARWIVDTD